MRIPRVVAKLIESFEKLPGIGPKTAQRLTFYLLHVPQSELDEFASAMQKLKKETLLCSTCKNVGETDPCSICSDSSRDKNIIMVVEQPLDIMAIEKTGKYKGIYHVLHGSINPLDNIGPEELYIEQLLNRVENQPKISEIILATNPTMEGEATAMYIRKQLKTPFGMSSGRGQNSQPEAGQPLAENLKITRLGVGIPTGADIEYADETTITQAIEGRRSY